MRCASCLDYLVHLKPELLNGQMSGFCGLYTPQVLLSKNYAIVILNKNLKYILLFFPSGAVISGVDAFCSPGHPLLRGCSQRSWLLISSLAELWNSLGRYTSPYWRGIGYVQYDLEFVFIAKREDPRTWQQTIIYMRCNFK